MTNIEAFMKANPGVGYSQLHPALMISVDKCFKAMDFLRRKETIESMNIKDIENFLRKKKLEKIKKL